MRKVSFILFLVLTILAIHPAPIFGQSKPLLDSLGGKHVSVGIHKLYVRELGDRNADMTIIFESGAGGSSGDWKKVIALLPPDSHVIVYDRAGLGKSEPGPQPRTMSQEVYELHLLLESLKIKKPIIIVGQSIGGLLARMYTEYYGKNVRGLVLVDPTHENSVLGSMRYGGWVRLREKASGKQIPKPQTRSKISSGFDSTADYMAEEFQNIFVNRSKKSPQLGNRPVVIIGAGVRKQPPGTPDDQWKQLRSERDQQVRELTSLSKNSEFILDPASGHLIHNDNPEIVAKSISLVLQAVRSKTRLK